MQIMFGVESKKKKKKVNSSCHTKFSDFRGSNLNITKLLDAKKISRVNAESCSVHKTAKCLHQIAGSTKMSSSESCLLRPNSLIKIYKIFGGAANA